MLCCYCIEPRPNCDDSGCNNDKENVDHNNSSCGWWRLSNGRIWLVDNKAYYVRWMDQWRDFTKTFWLLRCLSHHHYFLSTSLWVPLWMRARCDGFVQFNHWLYWLDNENVKMRFFCHFNLNLFVFFLFPRGLQALVYSRNFLWVNFGYRHSEIFSLCIFCTCL